MREFFRGWRRKIGSITLMMALCITAIWIRSFTIKDYIHGAGPMTPMPVVFVQTFDGNIGFDDTFPDIIRAKYLLWNSHPLGNGPVFGEPAPPPKWKYHLFGVGVFRRTEFAVMNLYALWPFVLLLTVLSVYLLLSKPRPRKPPESPKPTDEAQVTHA